MSTGMRDGTDLWVFAYGSLMWQPGFRHVEVRRARIHGYRRSFCIYSMHYRGNSNRPGLVLGLDRGGACEGLAFRVAEADRAEVRRYLAGRELIYGVYREAFIAVDLAGCPGDAVGARAVALAYVAEQRHPSYAGPLELEQQAAIIRAARGVAGTNLSYLEATLAKLAELRIRQPLLDRLGVLAGVAPRSGRGEAVHISRCGAFAAKPAAVTLRSRQRFANRQRIRHAFSFRRGLAE